MDLSLPIINLDDYPRFHAAQAFSPFRYPGGKAFLTGLLQDRVALLKDGKKTYAEPFCGGAGAAIKLLHIGAVTNIILNDLDVRIFSAWNAMLSENERFCERISQTSLDIETWHRMQETVQKSANEYDFELGFATFYLNRTSRGGIILGSGPIGGYDQKGSWKIEARFYRKTLLNRVTWIGSMKEKIRIYNLPAISFLKRLSRRKNLDRYLVFVDPPYFEMGSRLYFDGMGKLGHAELAHYLSKGNIPNWILTYDDHPVIRKLYSNFPKSQMSVQYSLQKRRTAKEILIENSQAA